MKKRSINKHLTDKTSRSITLDRTYVLYNADKKELMAIFADASVLSKYIFGIFNPGRIRSAASKKGRLRSKSTIGYTAAIRFANKEQIALLGDKQYILISKDAKPVPEYTAKTVYKDTLSNMMEVTGRTGNPPHPNARIGGKKYHEEARYATARHPLYQYIGGLMTHLTETVTLSVADYEKVVPAKSRGNWELIKVVSNTYSSCVAVIDEETGKYKIRLREDIRREKREEKAQNIQQEELSWEEKKKQAFDKGKTAINPHSECPFGIRGHDAMLRQQFFNGYFSANPMN